MLFENKKLLLNRLEMQRPVSRARRSPKCLKLVLPLEPVADRSVIVDLAVGSKNELTILAKQRLLSRSRIDDRQSFVCQYCLLLIVNATPVRPAMSQTTGHLQYSRS